MACYDTIHLEKGMYAMPGKSFTQVLEELDDSAQYVGTPLEGLDAYQRQLKRFGIRVSGPESDRLEKFFRSTSSAALFPEYVARAVRQGMESANHLGDIVATVTTIDALDYRAITAESESEGTYGLEETAEQAELPVTTIHTQNGLVNLKKRGRLINSSYEALRFHKLDVLTVLLRQIGVFIAASQTEDAVNTLLNGDGVNSGAKSTSLSAAMTYGDLISLWGTLSPYRLNTMLAGTKTIQEMLALDELKDATAGNNFHGTGSLCTPLGAKLIHVPGMAENKVIGLDHTCALEMVQAGGVLTDYDKLIDRQLDRAAVSTITGYAILFPDAAHVLNGQA